MIKLSEIRITDPCKKCLVQPMCTKVCEEFIKRMNFAEVMNIIKEKIYNIFKALFNKIYFIMSCIFSLIGFLITAVFLAIATALLFYGGLFAIHQLYLLWKNILV